MAGLASVVAPGRHYGILKRRLSEWLFPKSVFEGEKESFFFFISVLDGLLGQGI